MWYRIAKEIDRVSRPLFIFDIDDTLVTTGAEILVKRGDRVIASLKPAEYNTFDIEKNPIILADEAKYGPGDYTFDYTQFMDSLLFEETSKPIAPMIRKVKALMNRNPNGVVIFNTARSDFDAKEPVLRAFEKEGLPMDPAMENYIHINRSGNITGKMPTSEKKNELLLNRYLTPGHNFTSVHFWDDDAKNLDAFMNLTNREDAQHLRDFKLQAYRVKHDGSTEVWNNEARKRFDEQLQKKTQETAENLDVPALPQEPKQ
jgi:hypothetical protein